MRPPSVMQRLNKAMNVNGRDPWRAWVSACGLCCTMPAGRLPVAALLTWERLCCSSQMTGSPLGAFCRVY